MSGYATRVRTLLAIGATNGLRVLDYRLGLKSGLHPVQRVTAALPAAGPFFTLPSAVDPARRAPAAWHDEATLFGAYPIAIGAQPPAWTRDPLTEPGAQDPAPDTLPPWWQIGDFAGGDIKRVWELSRFDWAMAFAQHARAGEVGAVERLNHWIEDWVRANPAYRGPNWKCAQEASIRVLHLSVAAMLLSDATMSAPLRSLVDAHVRRILPTLSYARAQDNNHATSEAGALFVAGAWMTCAGLPEGAELARRGRSLIERAVARLFAPDGSFSQYSVNYHRVALDTLSIVELWRRRAGLPPFNTTWNQRASGAANWLRLMVDPASGDAPNLGANDGANLLPLTDAAYRDYRPSVQLATVLFQERRAFPPGPWDESLAWLGVAPPDTVAELPERAIFDDGGYAVLRQAEAMVMLRYPRFRFRPSHADAMHVDLWLAGRNLLRDGGSYSYNTEAEWLDYFGGVRSHNTIEFDARPQMPRLSRFLFGDWLATDMRRSTDMGFAAAYRHRAGWRHHREVRLDGHLTVIDTLDGFEREARLRWRLAPGDWRIEDGVVTDGEHWLEMRADVPIVSLKLTSGWESRHYLEKTPLPVLEAVITRPGRVTSEYRWTA
ncbi:alginate lyase family protein [Sphingomonas sp. HF-S4]|uniref:Alginate lyase family protein n=1 Tax=Sphingomonas agrestis TaxID=3080540 RepID=A0ABU3YAL5_9SPHN|nr:alginate lyase family protein [Sphingomonas sp. HF-S4]MDV3458443.1 alginate lyase family protein [Sphingomonas sp. HF-S4]